MSIHIFAFGPTPLVESLISLTETQYLVSPVGVKLDDEDSTVYHRLSEELTQTVKNDHLTPVIIFSPQLGDRFTTIALSIPQYNIYVISGMSAELLSALKSINGLPMIMDSKAVSSSKGIKEDFEIDSVVDHIMAKARRGLVMLNRFLRDAGEESNIDVSILETDISELT